MRQRAARHAIDNHKFEKVEVGDFLPNENASFDVVVFTEILEYITFNPVAFWRRLYELLRIGGMVYITTPNALTLGRFCMPSSALRHSAALV